MQNGRQLQGNVARRSQLRWALLNAGHSPCSPPSGPTCRAQHPEREINTYKDPVGTASLPVLVRFERKLHLGALGRRAGGLPASTAAVSADSASWPASNGKLSPGLRSLKGNKNFCSPPPTPVSLRCAAEIFFIRVEREVVGRNCRNY